MKGVLAMNYMGDATWWNERFKSRELNIMEHERCLEEDLLYFQSKKTVLDVASGDGRNAIYLAKLGFEVCGIDFSIEAIHRLNYFANKEKVRVQTELVDLWKDGLKNITKKYDAIIVNHYRLPQNLYVNLMNCLNTGGILWVNGFQEVPNDNPNVTESDILYEEDFKELNLTQLIDKKQYQCHNRKFVRYIWKK